ncbi:SGNH/GDSL hydrolase family protein [Euzebya sp.]|uniref:SGNH/GDSL hydrolase family protein n=1 Tax=Euzebya sp. TaxID=1971409 RepID=UPI003514FCED
MVVLGDSLSFHGPEGPVPLADPRLYPNVLGVELDRLTGRPWAVEVWGRAGWGVRELWLALQKDVHLQQQLLIPADAVVLGIGSADQLSVAVPRWVVMALPYLRPTGLRRALRRRIDHVHPALTRLTGGRMRYTPPSVIRHAWSKSVDAIRLFAGEDVPLVAVLPAAHRTTYYGGMTTHHVGTHRLVAELAAAKDVAAVDLAALTRDRLDELNVDGAHWSWAIHADVGTAMARALAAQLHPAPGARTPA